MHANYNSPTLILTITSTGLEKFHNFLIKQDIFMEPNDVFGVFTLNYLLTVEIAVSAKNLNDIE